MARRRVRNTRGRKQARPWDDTTQRASCYDVSAYQDLVWRELLAESLDVNERSLLAEVETRVPGFSRVFGREILHRLYEPKPRVVAPVLPGARLREQLHGIVAQGDATTPGSAAHTFATMRARSELDMTEARACAKSIVLSVARLLCRVRPNGQSDQERVQDQVDACKDLGIPGPSQADADAAAVGAQDIANQLGSLDRNDVDQTVAFANNEAAQATGADAGGTGGGGRVVVDHNRGRIIAGDPTLIEIERIAGRLTPTLLRLADDKRTMGGQERSTYAPTGNVSRLIPRELGMLAGLHGSARAADAYRRVCEGSALGHDGRGPGHGSMIVVLDQSGSMGQIDSWAKGVVMALAILCERSKRPFGLVLYDTNVKYAASWPRVNLDAVRAAVSTFSGGGTSWGPGMKNAIKMVEAARDDAGRAVGLRRSDIVHVTDGHPSDPGAAPAYRERARALGARIHGIAIGHDAKRIASDDTSVLAQWSDTICAVENVYGDDQAAMTKLASALA